MKPVFRRLLLLIIYSVIIELSFHYAYEVRFDFQVSPQFQAERAADYYYVLGIKLVALFLCSQFGSMLRYFGLPDLLHLLTAMAASSLVMVFPSVLGYRGFIQSRGVIVCDLLLCVAGFCTFRLALRVLAERLLLGRELPTIPLERIAIVGAGDSGAKLAKELLACPRRGFFPVMFFDDDPHKHGVLLHGVKVAGRIESLPGMKRAHGIKRVIIAMPSAPQRRLREIMVFLTEKGYIVETLPALEELASGRAKVTRIRPVGVEDLLGREEVKLDTGAIARFVAGKVVLVTGAGGSIGSELCRQIAKFGPKQLLLLDQSEPSLFLVEQEMLEAGLGPICVPLVADILDRVRMNHLCGRFRPEVVFHAAAHKHVHMMERQPAEAIYNNSLGTRLLAETVIAHDAEALILISTDKAVNPTSVMGASKRLAEIHLQAMHAANHHRTKLIMVRFGNVLGSSGSVVPIFKKQIAAGGPVTVTHPEVTRYFMSIPEAAGLVLQASVLGQGGEIFVLDMGQSVKILHLAQQMIKLSGFKAGDDIEIKFTGLKPGEKLFEELQHRDERHLATEHPRIMRFVPNGDARAHSRQAIEELEPLLHQADGTHLKRILQKIIPEYTPFLPARAPEAEPLIPAELS